MGKNIKIGKNSESSFLTFLLLLLLIFVTMSNLSQASEEKVKEKMEWADWAPLIVIALGIGYGLAAISYMLGQILRNSSLLAWSKNELMEINMSAIIVGIIFLVIVLIDSFFDAVIDPGVSGNTPLDVSTDFLNSKTASLIDAWTSSIGAEMMINVLAGPPLNLGGDESARGGGFTGATSLGKKPEKTGEGEQTGATVPIPPFFMFTIGDLSYFPFYGFSLFSSLLSQLSSFILVAIAITLSYGVVLSFIKSVALPVLIPLGIFLRIFNLTRKLGSTLIAMGLSLYVFFPVSVLILKGVIDSTPQLPARPSFTLCHINYDPGDLIRPFFGPDFDCETGGCCINCRRYFRELLDWFPVLKFVCYILNIILWLTCLVLAIVGIILWMVSVQVACIGGYGLVSGAGPWAQLPLVVSFTESFGNSLGEYTLNMIAHVSSLVIPIVISPVIMFIIVITGIRSVSAAIGGEVTILGIAGMI